MKKLQFFAVLLAIFILSVSFLRADDPFKISVSQLNINRKDNKTYSVDFSVSYASGLSFLIDEPEMCVLYEKYLINGLIEDNIIREQDFLFAQRNVDLNGDGDFKDSYKTRKSKDKFYIENKIIKSLIYPRKINNLTGFQYYDGKKERIYSLAPGGEKFSLYYVTRDGKALFATGSQEQPLKIIKIPNPSVQLLLIKTVNSLQEPGFSISEGENRLTFTNEQIISNQAGSWAAILWTAMPITANTKNRNDFTLTISGITPPFSVMAAVNISLEKGIRMRSNPVKKEILK